MTTSYFQNAHHFVSNIDTVITASNYIQNTVVLDRAFEQLRENISDGAVHNSYERSDPPMCHPDTRRAVQEMVFSWIAHDDGPKRILWMSGPAGCGKTAIAGSIAEVCEEKGLLVATFFFSSFAGSPSRRWKRFLIPTLVYQLMQSDGTGTLREHIISSVKRDPTVFRKRLKDQCKILLLEPLQRFTASRLPSSPQVIVIDGLDEVESEATTRDSSGSTTRLQAIQANEIDQVEILSALLQLVSNPFFPFRIFISSRPERWIRGFFAAEAAKSVTRELFLDDKYNPDDDIELFLRNKFSDIRHRYNIPSNWPTENAIKTLVHRASGQFIYAATAIRFVQDGTHPPALQLERVLQLKHEATDGSPLAALDALYVNVLSSGPEPWLASEWIMLLGTEHYPSLPARYCRQLFETTTGQAEHLLGNLSSLTHTPAFDDVSSPYRIYHRSLCDFLRVQRGQYVSRRDAMGLREKSYIQIFQSASITVGCCLVPNDSLVFDRSLPDKAPWIPLAPSEARPFFQTLLKDDWASFLESVLTVFGKHNSRGITGSHLELEWWVRTAMASNPDLAPQNIAQMFWRVHADCDDEWDMCSSLCLQWRKAILRCCRSNGWSTPGERDLAEEKRWKLAWNLDNDARPFPFYEFEHCFKPPGSSIAHLLGPS